MWQEFNAFIMRGSVVDLAVGIIIGAAFGRIVSALVTDILMPPIGLLLGRVDFSNLFEPLGPALCHAGRGQSGRRRDDQLRAVPQHGDRVPHRGLGGVSADPPP
jgi:hypothetical protein